MQHSVLNSTEDCHEVSYDTGEVPNLGLEDQRPVG